MEPSSDWFVIPEPRNEKKIRLVCFPYAGGGASAFRHWAKKLSHPIEFVIGQLPGRDSRYAEPLLDNIHDIADRFYSELIRLTEIPTVIFGHSLGCLIGYEVCKRLTQNKKDIYAKAFIAAAKAAPCFPMKKPHLHTLGIEELKQRLMEYRGTPREVLEHPELFEFVAPRLKADFKVAETYLLEKGEEHGSLSCPIHIYGGKTDTSTNFDKLKEWEKYTSGKSEFLEFDGDHFFVFSKEDEVISKITTAVLGYVG